MQRVDISTLALGKYEFRLTFTNLVSSNPTAQATGVLTVYPPGAGHYETRQVAVQVPVTVSNPDPSNYIIAWTGQGPTYGAPVVTRYDAMGNPVFGQGYGRDVIGYGESGEPLYPYVLYKMQNMKDKTDRFIEEMKKSRTS